jgi:hypothetical protein
MSEVIDAIEILGAAVERDDIDPITAASVIADASCGGLDLADAADWLRHWKTARATCEALAAYAADRLIAIALDLPRGAA